jgi:hypothetical protein
MVDKTTGEAIQKRDIIVTQVINELGITIETNTKPLIRCKDCKFYKTPYCKIDIHTDIMTINRVNADDFCSYGERKENE